MAERKGQSAALGPISLLLSATDIYYKWPFHSRPLREQAVATHSAPIMEFRRSAFAPKADVEVTKQPSRRHHPDCCPSCVEAAAALLCGTVSARAHFTKEMHKRAGERVLLQSILNVLSSLFPPHQARVLKDR